MTRIIGGVAGGRQVRTPPGDRTRPTSDRVREALFSSLESFFGSLEGLHVLDLYAGSGALGLEAASRGAASVTLVEAHGPTARLIEANARSLGLDARVLSSSVGTALATLPAIPVDLVLADPPYDLTTQLDADLRALDAQGWLAEDALVVVERSRRSVEPSWPEGWGVERFRKYGETVLWYVHAAPHPGP